MGKKDSKGLKRKPSGSKIPAIPPNDYKGTIAGWMVSLQEMGLWDMQKPEWYGDVRLTPQEYNELLKRTEK